jgi:hypothetical protein
MRARAVVALSALLLTACQLAVEFDRSRLADDGSNATDAGTLRDAATNDAATNDAATNDAATNDGAMPDGF